MRCKAWGTVPGGPSFGNASPSLNDSLSGHGFKLAPALGMLPAQEILGQPQDIDFAAYDLNRFARGDLLTGAYGVGSIS